MLLSQQISTLSLLNRVSAQRPCDIESPLTMTRIDPSVPSYRIERIPVDGVPLRDRFPERQKPRSDFYAKELGRAGRTRCCSFRRGSVSAAQRDPESGRPFGRTAHACGASATGIRGVAFGHRPRVRERCLSNRESTSPHSRAWPPFETGVEAKHRPKRDEGFFIVSDRREAAAEQFGDRSRGVDDAVHAATIAASAKPVCKAWLTPALPRRLLFRHRECSTGALRSEAAENRSTHLADAGASLYCTLPPRISMASHVILTAPAIHRFLASRSVRRLARSNERSFGFRIPFTAAVRRYRTCQLQLRDIAESCV